MQSPTGRRVVRGLPQVSREGRLKRGNADGHRNGQTECPSPSATSPRCGHQSRKGRENRPVAGTNRGRGER
eukprot:8114536-Pyramimonas_sp.AAC.1